MWNILQLLHKRKLRQDPVVTQMPFIPIQQHETYPLTIRITTVPFGDAPLDVRQQWVGVELPARGPIRTLSSPCEPLFLGLIQERLVQKDVHVKEQRRVYAASIATALERLQQKNTEAYNWFAQRLDRNFLSLGEFTFATEEAEIVN